MKIPTQDNFQVGVDQLPQSRFNAPSFTDAGETASRLGHAISGASNQAADFIQKITEENNALLVDDALAKLKDKAIDLRVNPDSGYMALKGRNALERPEGKSLVDEYDGYFSDAQNAIFDTLKNDAQRNRYSQLAQGIRQTLRQETSSYMLREHQAFTVESASSQIDLGRRAFALAANDDERASALARIGMNMERIKNVNGWDDATFEVKMRSVADKSIGQALDYMLDNADYDGANAMLNQYKDYADADTVLKSWSRINSARSDDLAQKVGAILANANGVVELDIPSTINQGGGLNFQVRPDMPDYTPKNIDDLKRLSKDPNVKSLLNLISFTEGTEKHGYNTLVGGGKIDDLSKHPNVVGLETKDGKSTAFGRYQIVGKTWRGLQRKYGFTDINPESQDAAAVALIAQRGALGDVLRGDYKKAVAKLGNEWVSLPGSSNTNQGERSWAAIDKRFNGVSGASSERIKVDTRDARSVEDAISRYPKSMQAAIRSRLSHIQAANEAQRREAEAQRDNTVADIIVQNGGDYSKVPQSIKQQYSAKDWLKMQNFGDAVRNQRQDELFEKNKVAYYDLMLNPEKMESLSEDQIMAKGIDIGLNKSSALIKAKREYEESKAKGKKPESLVNRDVINSIATIYKIDHGAKASDESIQRYYSLAENVRSLAEDMKARLGRNPTEAELIESARKMMAEETIVEKGWIWDDKVPTLTLTREEKQKAANIK